MRRQSRLGLIETLSPLNRQLFDYWQSLRTGGVLPPHAAFDQAAVPNLMPGTALVEVAPGQSVTCRLAGPLIGEVLGVNMEGRDWLDLALPANRAQHLIRYSAVAQGHAGIARSKLLLPGTPEPERMEIVMLPFAPLARGVPVLVHADWRPEADGGPKASFAEFVRLADEFFLIDPE